MKRKSSLRIVFYSVLLSIFLPSCKKEIVPKAFYPRSAHEAYAHSLEQANLHQTALGRDWMDAGRRALEESIEITLPFEEAFYWDPRNAEAGAYRFFVNRGIRVEVEIGIQSADSLLLFADLFRERGDTLIQRIHVATADEERHRLEFEPRRDAFYALRLQPELLRGGRFKVSIRAVPAIAFPVKGKNSRSIASFFGDPRDGGSRDHHGVDIFAPRHTPVLAPSDASVTRVGEGDIGGRYVWLYDSKRSMYLYFAHLETRDVERGDKVRAGQLIGTVGNTGNARTTAPHLHFGIYSNGPIDPFHFIAETDTVTDRIVGDPLVLGRRVRTGGQALMISAPAKAEFIADTLDAESMMTLTALTGNLCRVQLPDGSSGYIAEKQVEVVRDTVPQKAYPSSASPQASTRKK
jgi:murein DD-endopeptidase MepM/ murein hydrolase activator NlpD